jgi:hypothetical protein
MGILSSIYNYIFGVPDDDGEGGGIIFRLGSKIIWFSIILYVGVSLFGYEHSYIYGVNQFLWSGIVGLIIAIIPVAMNPEEEPKKDISVLDKEINEMKSKLDELEKEKAKEVPDYSEYNEKMDEEPPVL